jgi:hypothetical protein
MIHFILNNEAVIHAIWITFLVTILAQAVMGNREKAR